MNDEKKRASKGEGSISRRADGTYMGRITLSGYKPYCCYGKTQRDVRKKINEYKARIIRGETDSRKILVHNYIEEWLITYKSTKLKPSSYDRLERTYLNHIKNSSISYYQLGNITTNDIQKLINEKQLCLSYSSLKKIYLLLNECFNHAEIVRDISYNPMKGVTLPKESLLPIKTKQIEVLTSSDILRLQNAAAMLDSHGNPKFIHGYAIILMLNTGLRAGEALCLKWDSVELDSSCPVIHVAESVSMVKNRNLSTQNERKQIAIVGDVKTSSGKRDIPLNQSAYEAIIHLKKYQDMAGINTDYVIATKSGKMVIHGAFQRSLDYMLRSCNIKHVGLHALRHTFATNLIEKNVDIKIISQLMGHASTNITYNTYVHPSADAAISAVAKLDSVL